MSRTSMQSVRVVVVFLLWVASCAPTPVTPRPATSTPTNTSVAATDTPTATPTDTSAPPTDTPTPTDTPPPSDLATEFSVFYANPDTGIDYILTPWRESLGITAEELAQNPGALENQVLGTLMVVQSPTGQFTPGIYTIRLDPSAEGLLFDGPAGVVVLPVVIRSLPLPLPPSRPVAMISSVQMCLAWDTLQICGLIDTPLRGDLLEKLVGAIQELGANPDEFALDRAIPDVEGDNVLAPCLEQLQKPEPVYAECQASVLAVPALQALEPPSVVPEANNTSVLVVLENLVLNDDVFADPQLTQLLGELPAGNYLMYNIIFPDDPVIDTYNGQQVTASRVALSLGVDQEPAFYLRAVIGAPLTGEPVVGTPPEGPEAVISNMWIRGSDGIWSCYFQWWQCPWVFQ